MIVHKATLIQDVSEYLELLKMTAEPIIETLRPHYGDINIEVALRWVIAEELELIYGIFTDCHVHNQYPYAHIHNYLQFQLPLHLSQYTALSIKAPKLYHATDKVAVELKGCDLYIYYFTQAHFPYYHLQK